MMTDMIISLVPLLVAAAVYVWFGRTMGRLFALLGVEPWKAWVPIINQLEMLKCVNRSSSQIIIIAFIPLYGLYVYYQVLLDMTRLRGRDEKLALLGLILPPVWAVKMTDDGASHLGAGASAVAAGPPPQPGQGVPVGGSVPSPSPSPSPLAQASGIPAPAPTAYAPPGSPPSAVPAAVQAAPDRYAPFAPVGAVGPPTVQPAAWPVGADPTVSSPAWSAAPVPPVQGAGLTHGAPAQAASGRPVAPPQMPAQPAQAPYTVIAPVPVQAGSQAPEMPPAASVMPALPARQPTLPGPPQAAAPVAMPAPHQPPAMAAPVMLPAGASVAPPSPPTVAPGPRPQPVAAPEPAPCTVLIDRAASRPWSLLLDDGRRFDLWSPTVLVGRAPSSADPGTQLLAIPDETCTISKVHARLDLMGGAWQVTDAGSTNGIIVTRAGRAYTVPSGTSATVDEHLVLGSVGMRLASGASPQQART